MKLLSSDPTTSMDFEPFLAKVWFALGICFSFVWSGFKIRLSGILWLSTRDTISCNYKSWASFSAPSGTSILPIVFMHFLKPILRKRLFTRDDESRSMWSNIKYVSSYQNFSNGYHNNHNKLSNHLYFGEPIKTFGLFDLNSPIKADALSVKHLDLAPWGVFLFWLSLALLCT